MLLPLLHWQTPYGTAMSYTVSTSYIYTVPVCPTVQFLSLCRLHLQSFFQNIDTCIRIPVMNGYEATKMIRSLDREDAKEIPIIAMTANAFTEDRIRAKEAGMDEHIAKPVDVELLIKVIHKLVEYNGYGSDK